MSFDTKKVLRLHRSLSVFRSAIAWAERSAPPSLGKYAPLNLLPQDDYLPVVQTSLLILCIINNRTAVTDI